MLRISQEEGAQPWAGDVVYWHPGFKQVRVLNLHADIPAVGRGVGDGRFTFDEETAEGFLNLQQLGAMRKLSSRWVFNGRDRYHDTLLEDTGSGFQTLVAWDFVRVKEGPGAKARVALESPAQLPDYLKEFQPLFWRTWEASGNVEGSEAADGERRVRSTYEWFPSLELIVMRVTSPGGSGAARGLLDAYIYNHLGTKELRCLALSHEGDVYEGEMTVVDGNSLEFDLNGHEKDLVNSYLMRVDFERDGLVRQRVWSVDENGRRLKVDLRHKAMD